MGDIFTVISGPLPNIIESLNRLKKDFETLYLCQQFCLSLRMKGILSPILAIKAETTAKKGTGVMGTASYSSLPSHAKQEKRRLRAEDRANRVALKERQEKRELQRMDDLQSRLQDERKTEESIKQPMEELQHQLQAEAEDI